MEIVVPGIGSFSSRSAVVESPEYSELVVAVRRCGQCDEVYIVEQRR
jgi:hypothetical protein